MRAINLQSLLLPPSLRFFSTLSSPRPFLPCRSFSSPRASRCRSRATVIRFSSCGAMATASAPPSVRLRDTIELTGKERQIFDRLLATVRHFNLPTQLRVAGGWVRDKVTEYLASTGEEAQGLAVIPSNPDQSKHLETARMRLYDVWIDFVNLRSEKYSENSRIPTQMDFGTAEEDAYRRDLTINSMFYNINTSSVEDLTGRGIEDLKSGRIVTPLPPKETFLDDPLRVLRAIRFGARFRFTLDEELKKAAAADDVRDALAAKISKERIGTEIDLMISGNEPVKAVEYIYDLQLFSVVFGLPPDYEPALPDDCNRFCVTYLGAGWNLLHSIGSSVFNDDQRRLALYAALFFPFRKATYKDNKAKKIPVVNYIFRNSLKRKASDAEMVIGVHSAAERFLKLIPSLESDRECDFDELDLNNGLGGIPASSKLRVSVGFLLRDIKDFWRVALLISMLSYPSDVGCSEDSLDNSKHPIEKRREAFKVVEDAIFRLGLEKVWEAKPLLNGKEIMSVLQLKAGGPLVREWQQRILAWQLANPSGTAEECLDWMRETHQKRVKLE
ncbi:tRNA nucleotidyltransferase cca2 isoform X2 [Punica granatum]|uniref:tRNA nucleotidyltransferase cca2 isoform X2 n=1 Tax=Punica granatum TaxID=22663 RepID=A0A6P8DDD6_PUNGR|nr:tRNA nucleotidyltransferase cca2 isoform X2 [Punica granatum]